jgi:hypothetical protein
MATSTWWSISQVDSTDDYLGDCSFRAIRVGVSMAGSDFLVRAVNG